MSEDPRRDGENWFAYCSGNPVNLSDATGKAAQWVLEYAEYILWVLGPQAQTEFIDLLTEAVRTGVVHFVKEWLNKQIGKLDASGRAWIEQSGVDFGNGLWWKGIDDTMSAYHYNLGRKALGQGVREMLAAQGLRAMSAFIELFVGDDWW